MPSFLSPLASRPRAWRAVTMTPCPEGCQGSSPLDRGFNGINGAMGMPVTVRVTKWCRLRIYPFAIPGYSGRRTVIGLHFIFLFVKLLAKKGVASA